MTDERLLDVYRRATGDLSAGDARLSSPARDAALLGELRRVVAAPSEEAALGLIRWWGQDPAYLRGVVRALREAARPSRPIVSVDFDGVIHSYASGWQGASTIPDPPVPGAFAWLGAAVQRFEVCVYSSRSAAPGAIDAMRGWFLRHGLPAPVLAALAFPAHKPKAILTIDDRAFCFEGRFPDLDWIERFRPWNRR